MSLVEKYLKKKKEKKSPSSKQDEIELEPTGENAVINTNEEAKPSKKKVIAKKSAPTNPISHKVSVTISDPNHPHNHMRKAKTMRIAHIKTKHPISSSEALEHAKKHYAGAGYKVHRVEYHSKVHNKV